MKWQCDLVMNGINKSMPFKRKKKESVDKQLDYFWGCTEFAEVMGGLPYLVDAKAFSCGMKERILAMVFDEESNFSAGKNTFY